MLDCVSNRALHHCLRALTPTGRYVAVAARKGNWIAPLVSLLQGRLLAPFISQQVTALMATRRNADLLILQEMINAGTITPVLDRQYALHELPDAIRYSEAGHARGKIVINMEEPYR